jgi:hypothetical protein
MPPRKPYLCFEFEEIGYKKEMTVKEWQSHSDSIRFFVFGIHVPRMLHLVDTKRGCQYDLWIQVEQDVWDKYIAWCGPELGQLHQFTDDYHKYRKHPNAKAINFEEYCRQRRLLVPDKNIF